MIQTVLAKVFGTRNERELKRIAPRIAEINALEPAMQALSDEQLQAKTLEFHARIVKVLENVPEEDKDQRVAIEKQALNDILPEAFAVCREGGRRVLNMRHFDVQLIGGIVLHEGTIAEMKTGEGKTLVATLPVYLNALLGRGVHVVTVNDYLAKRDSDWMGRLYRFLGLSVGVVVHDMEDEDRFAAYRADVTYGTNSELGFDYLRDNMKFRKEECVQRPHYYAIVDEVDSILIDEARTPLIISGASEESTDKYYRIDRIIPKLTRDTREKDHPEIGVQGDYVLDEKHRTCSLTEEGVAKCEKLLGVENLYDPANMDLIHHVYQGLKAHNLFQRDKDYVAQDNQVIIVDEFTGRLMPGRRWSDGLHQAVEAKEGVKIERENQTLATITYQNFFRMYKKLSGMTGTADTEAAEFSKIYKLEVLVMPTNRKMIRKEYPDLVYRTEREKFDAVVNELKVLAEKGQPVLVGTIAIEKSEHLSKLLKKAGVKHEVLNAKQHEREAYIVAQAGRKGVVTVSTNMAGRGTDILLGGNPDFMTKEVCLKEKLAELLPGNQEAFGSDENFVYFLHLERFYRVARGKWEAVYAKFKAECDKEHDEVTALGGLHILGTERHEARRIDNQLRGRSGRQGDPGSSRFYLSLEDDLLRIFAGERISGIMHKLGMEEGVPIESGLITRRIEAAQRAVEGQNFEARKHLLEYDDVMNKQREAVYGLRNQLLEGEDQREFILSVSDGIVDAMLDTYCPTEAHAHEWDMTALGTDMLGQFGIDLEREGLAGQLNRLELRDALVAMVHKKYEAKEKLVDPKALRFHERMIMLQVVDNQWKDHLLAMDHLKEGIGLRGYGQKDPLIEYKKESFTMFQEMMDRIESETIRVLWLMQISVEGGEQSQESERPSQSRQQMDEYVQDIERKKKRQMDEIRMSTGGDAPKPETIHRGEKVGRNDPCPCGSGKKYKKCHGVDSK
jgi:preprotein translocase subunit SecA